MYRIVSREDFAEPVDVCDRSHLRYRGSELKPFNPNPYKEHRCPEPDACERRPSCCATWPSPSVPVVALRSGSLRGRPRARSTPSWVRTAPASRRWSRSSPACTAATPAWSELHGEDVDFGSTAESKAAGVAVIYQEPTLFPDLSVTENIFMGRQPIGRARGASTGPRCTPRPSGLFQRLGVAIDPRRPARGLSIADQQIIEIAKAISLDASVLVMDEPTAALSGVEVDRLFAVARSLRDEGRALVFISHRFDEVFALCDTVTVMRDGDYVSTDADRRDLGRADRLPDGRPRGRRALPEDPRRDRRRRPRRRRACPRPAPSTTSPSTSAPARSSAWPASSAPAAARSPGPSSASTGTTRARSGSPGDRRACPRSRAPRSRPASPSSPRTAASRAWSPRARSPATSPA